MSKVTDHYTDITAHFAQPSRTRDHQRHPVSLEEALPSTKVCHRSCLFPVES